MKRVGRIVHIGVTYVLLAGVVLQPFLIGLWLFGAVATSDLHIGLGYLLLIPGCALLLLAALVGWLPRREMLLTLAVIVDTFVQVSLPSFRTDLPAVAALHPVNFLVLVVMLWTLGRWDRLLIKGDAVASSSVPAV